MAKRRRRGSVERWLGSAERWVDRQQKRSAQRQQRRTIAQGKAEAEAHTARVERRNVELSQMLVTRPQELHRYRKDVEQAFVDRDAFAVSELVERILSSTDRPRHFPRSCAVGHDPNSRTVRVAYELPGRDMIPPSTGSVFDNRLGEVVRVPAKPADLKNHYRKVLALTMLRAVADVFDATPPDLVHTVAVNGYVSDKDPSTGQPHDFVLASVRVARDTFSEVALTDLDLDAVACLLRFDARLSPRPYDLQAVPPVVTFDPAKYRAGQDIEVNAGTDARIDLLAMRPREFELLVKKLFQDIGLRAWETQETRDGGIDVIAVVEDEVTGMDCVIEVKKYRNAVPPKEVRSLHGAMIDRNVHKAFLVTTAWFGPSSYSYAARNRIDLYDGKRLKHLLLTHCGIDAIIPLPKVPPGWSPRDIT